jgi:nucleotidyltransferase substrate binding protein (TIGR01987 family)
MTKEPIMNSNIRWQQRFQNLDRAVQLLREPLTGVERLSLLEQEGLIQRFEFTLELAWKTLKDYLEFSGVVIEPATPRNVVKEAFAAKILPDGQVWIDMLDHRNLLSHTYDEKLFCAAVDALADRYLPAIIALHEWFQERTAS